MKISDVRLIDRRVRAFVKRRRVRAAERIGIERYSRPALFDLDRKLSEFLPARGVYLEIGANDGYAQSNTYRLDRELDWDGILIEPVGRLASACRRMRPRARVVRAACVAPEAAGRSVRVADQGLMSVVVGRSDAREQDRLRHRGRLRAVPTVTLSDVIESSPYERIDFMSIDVEGAELDVLAGLRGLDAPRWLLIETEQLEAVRDWCATAGLRQVAALTKHDYLFTRVERCDSRQHR